MKKVGVSTEEKNLSYYRFFEQDLAEIPQEKLQILKGGPSQIKAVPFEEKNLFLAGKDEAYCQTGYGIMEDGTGFVCNTTYMPGVTGEMLALEIVDTWLDTEFSHAERHQRRIDKMMALENE